MTGILTTQVPFPCRQLFHHIAIANGRARERNFLGGKGLLQTQVRHYRTDYAAIQQAPGRAMGRDDVKQLIAIDDCAFMIDHGDAIAIAVEGDADVRS